MNLKDFLELKNRYFARGNLLLLLFSFLYTFLFLCLFWFLIKRFSFGIYFTDYYKLFYIFLYPFIILLFLYLYNLGVLFSNIIVKLPFRKKEMLVIGPKEFNSKNFIKNFDFQGIVNNQYENKKCLYLTASHEGILTKKAFGNCIVKFKTKILDHGFAVITNAQDFGNYFMFRIGFDDNGLWIIPHVRKDGIWEIQSLKSENENKIKIGQDNILNFQITTKRKEALILEIYNKNKLIKTFEYILPSHFPLLPENDADKLTPKNIVTQIKWPKYGKVGFRAHGEDEKAIIYNLSIKEI